jgi:hypothetical protein
MPNMKLFCALAGALLSSGLPACGQSAPAGAGPEPEKSSTSQFVVGPFAILMPQGVFLLIRKGGKIGAIRFTSIEQGSPLARNREGQLRVLLSKQLSGSFRSPNVRKQTAEINLKPLKGIGRLAFQIGNDNVKVGDWSFGTGYPGRLDMWPYRGSQKDYGYEFAPTSAQSIDEIDASNKDLKWFRYTTDAKVVLPVSELPK